MNDIELYTKLLGIRAPWLISNVQVSIKDRTVTISVSYDNIIPTACPICNGHASIYDHMKRRWRHLDTMQFKTIIECDVPRVSCEDHGVKQLPVAWAEEKGRFTALFEALVIHWLKECSISGVAQLLDLSWDEVAGIQERAVKRGLERKKKQPLKSIAIDETSFQKHHEYVTVILDRDKDIVLDVLDDRKEESLENWLKDRPIPHLASLQTITMDMWDPYIKAVKNSVFDANEKISFDRYHVAQHFGKALDKVRSQEHRQFLSTDGESPLSGTKYDWQKNSAQIDNRSRREFMSLSRMKLKTARAWAIKETAAQLWGFSYRGAAEKAWCKLLSWIARCRLEPVKRVGRMVRQYLWGIINAIIAGTSNAIAEAKNARIQRIKNMACGYRNRKRFKMAILFHLGGLNLMPRTLKYAGI